MTMRCVGLLDDAVIRWFMNNAFVIDTLNMYHPANAQFAHITWITCCCAEQWRTRVMNAAGFIELHTWHTRNTQPQTYPDTCWDSDLIAMHLWAVLCVYASNIAFRVERCRGDSDCGRRGGQAAARKGWADRHSEPELQHRGGRIVSIQVSVWGSVYVSAFNDKNKL